MNRPCALPIYSVIKRRDGRDFGISGVPLRRVPSKPYLAPYGYLAVNGTESGGAFRQECGLRVTIDGKSETGALRVTQPLTSKGSLLK